jgi:hypothetical protein
MRRRRAHRRRVHLSPLNLAPVSTIRGGCQEIRLSDVAFVVDGTGYVMSGNREVIALFLETFQPGA